MSVEVLSNDFHKEMENMKKEKENTIGCHIKVDNGLVKVTIPMKVMNSIRPVALTEDDTVVEDRDIILTFSKREVKEFLQDIYVS